MNKEILESETLLEVEALRVLYETDQGPAVTIDGLSFDVRRGDTLGVVGESGSGKSTMALAVLGLLPRSAKVTGSIRFRGQELIGLAEEKMRQLRGNEIAMVFQDALAALNPAMTVGEQLAEAVRVHRPGTGRTALRRRAVELLDLVGIPSPDVRVGQYPHEFSGGMRQRVMIAMSVANEPALLIADEPTTALDVTVRAQILDVLREVQEKTGTTVLLITHDLGVVAGSADRVLVMYGGNRVEAGSVEQLFYQPAHPYTRGLLDSLPRMDRRVRGQRLFQIPGQPPSPTALPTGCRFGPRCTHFVEETCGLTVPTAHTVGPDHDAACERIDDIGTVRR